MSAGRRQHPRGDGAATARTHSPAAEVERQGEGEKPQAEQQQRHCTAADRLLKNGQITG